MTKKELSDKIRLSLIAELALDLAGLVKLSPHSSLRMTKLATKIEKQFELASHD